MLQTILLCFLVIPFIQAADAEIVIAEYSDKERRCYDEIFRPSIGILRTLIERNQQGEEFAPHLNDVTNQSSLVREIAERLLENHIDQLSAVLKKFNHYLLYEEQFVKAYERHTEDISDTVTIGGGSALIGIALSALGSIAQLWQGDCIKYDCLDKDFSMLTTDQVNGAPYHYCAEDGTAFECLSYLNKVYGYNDLTDAKYVEYCSDDVDEALVKNQTKIQLGQIVDSVDNVCRGLLFSLPYIPGTLFFIPGVVLSAKSLTSFVRLKISAYQFNNASKLSDGIDGLTFIDGKNLVSEISPQLAEIITFVGNFYNLSISGENFLDRLLDEDPIHNKARLRLNNTSLWQTIKSGVKAACCCWRPLS